MSKERMGAEAPSGADAGVDGTALASRQTAQTGQGQSLQHGNGLTGLSDTEERTSVGRGQDQPG